MAEDEEGKHSRHVCYTCVSKMRRAKSNSVGAVKSARLSKNNSSHIWCHFVAGDVSACSVCAHRRPIVLSFGTIKKQKAVQHNSCEININGNEYMETNFLIQSPSINPVQEVPLFLRQLRHANQSTFFFLIISNHEKGSISFNALNHNERFFYRNDPSEDINALSHSLLT